MLLIEGSLGRSRYKEGFEQGSINAEFTRLFFSQLRFVHNEESVQCGFEYLDASLELASHHFPAATRNLSKATLTRAVDKHWEKYKEQLLGLSVTSSDNERIMLGDSKQVNLRVIRCRDLPCHFAKGTPGGVVADELLRQILAKLPAKMSGGVITG